MAKTLKTYMTITMDPDIKSDFHDACKNSGMNMSETIRFLMEDFVKTYRFLRDERKRREEKGN